MPSRIIPTGVSPGSRAPTSVLAYGLLALTLTLLLNCRSATKTETAEPGSNITTAETPTEARKKGESGPETSTSSDPSPRTETAAATTPNPAGGPFDVMQIPLAADGNPRALTMEETIRLVLTNNNSVRMQQLEIVKSDTDLKKEESRYAPKVDFKASYGQREDKLLPATIFQGTRIQQNAYTAGVEKVFESGTYARVEGSDTRFDSNAGEGLTAMSSSLLSQLAQPPMHTGAVSLMLQQELMKNAFGYSQRRLMEIARKKALLQREQLEYQLTGLVVKTMVDYWGLAIAEQEMVTAKLLLNNTTNLRNITAQKVGIGLAEGFELNQWNALVSSADIQLKTSELNRDKQRADLLRTMNLDPGTRLTGATELIQVFPSDIAVKDDVEFAIKNRPDLRAVDRQMELTRLSAELAENNLLPTVRIGGKYSSRDWGRYSDMAFNAVPSLRYPETGVEFYVQYPLWDEGAKVDARNARVAMRQLQLQKDEIYRQVRDDISLGYDQLKVAFDSLEKSRYALQQTEAFYYGLVVGYQRGRFTAVSVKNALDALIQTRQALTRATIQYNIALIRYDMARNKIFVKNNIDISDVITRLENRIERD